MSTESAVSPREFGQLEADVKYLRADVERMHATMIAMADQMKEMRDAVVSVRGGWKTVMTLITISGSFGALLAKFLPTPPLH